MKTPDFTPPAITALILGAVANVIVLVGFDITDAQKAAIDGLITTGVLVAFLIHDAVVRNGRAKVAAAAVSSGTQSPARLLAAVKGDGGER